MIRMLVAAFALGFVLSAAVADAAPISTTSCKAIADRKMSKDGKNYTCTGCQECKTTTCEGEGGINCSIATTTSCGDCTEVASGPKASQGAIIRDVQPEVLDPGPRPKKKLKLLQPGSNEIKP